MFCAYNECYLDDAMQNLGEAMDFAVNSCHISPDHFMDMFITGGLADQFGHGVPKYVSGLSGTELAYEVFSKAGLVMDEYEDMISYDFSDVYWSGWILAYYQWKRNLRFKQIRQFLPVSEIIRLYPALHEASEERFVDAADAIASGKMTVAALQTIRRAANYSQRLLSERSGVSLRMIQQYEQGVKDIRKASGSSLQSLANALGCRMEDLLP